MLDDPCLADDAALEGEDPSLALAQRSHDRLPVGGEGVAGDGGEVADVGNATSR